MPPAGKQIFTNTPSEFVFVTDEIVVPAKVQVAIGASADGACPEAVVIIVCDVEFSRCREATLPSLPAAEFCFLSRSDSFVEGLCLYR